MKKILLVEDEKELADIFSMKLKGEGFDVEVLENGLKVAAKIKEYKPDLVLLDLVMADMDGYEVLEALKLKKSKQKRKYLLYAWSNLTQKNEIEKAKKMGVDDYLIKSNYTPSKLAEKINQILK